MRYSFQIITALIISYFVGNISPAILLGKIYGVDIRSEGSGNPGTTNVLRVLGKKAALMTLLIDILKGTIPVFLADLLVSHEAAMYCVPAVIAGHLWPVFFGFKGGKGVATAFGALMGLNPLLGLTALGIVALGVLLSQRMSVGSILGAATFPVVCWFMEADFIYMGTVLAIIVLYKHRSNIGRLVRGEEPKMFGKNKAKNKDK